MTSMTTSAWAETLTALDTSKPIVVAFDMDECIAPSGNVFHVFVVAMNALGETLYGHRYEKLPKADKEDVRDCVAHFIGKALHSAPCIRPGFAELVKMLRGRGCKVVLCTSADNRCGHITKFVHALKSWFAGFTEPGCETTFATLQDVKTKEHVRELAGRVRACAPVFDDIICGEHLEKWRVSEGGEDAPRQKNAKWMAKALGWNEDSPVIVVEDNPCWVTETPFVLGVPHFTLAVDYNAVARAVGALRADEEDHFYLSRVDMQNRGLRDPPYTRTGFEKDDVFLAMHDLLCRVLNRCEKTRLEM